jgi:hypothetical protein
VPNGTYTSGDHSATDNNALSAANFVIGGSATATLVAGNCIQLLPGFRATVGTGRNHVSRVGENRAGCDPASPDPNCYYNTTQLTVPPFLIKHCSLPWAWHFRSECFLVLA